MMMQRPIIDIIWEEGEKEKGVVQKMKGTNVENE